MLGTKRIAGLVLLAMAGGHAPATAQARTEKPLTLILSAGGEYDSNVAVEQTDTVTRKGDGLAVLGAEARYAIKPAQRLKVTPGYAFEQTLHNRFSAFDLQTHTLSLGAERKAGPATLAADYSFMHVLLGGRGFLDMHQVSPSISGFAARAVYLRGAFTYTRKTFRTAKAFDASNYQAGADAYYFMMRSKGYLSLSGRYESERTAGPELAYKGFQLGANLQLPVREARLKLGYSYRERHYDNVTAAIGAKRRETRSVVRLAADVTLLGTLRFKPEFRYIDRNSNAILADYREYVGTGAFTYQF